MTSRWPMRLISAVLTFWFARLGFARRKRSDEIRKVLVAHHLLLGDTILLAPLLKKLRTRFSDAQIVVTCRPAYLTLFENCPYGVTAIPFDPRNVSTFRNLYQHRGFDLAILPGDNRFSWLARALDARWIVAFRGANSAYKNWLIDEFRDFPIQPMAWGDLLAAQLLDGPAPKPFATGEWSSPSIGNFRLPDQPYCVLHIGARTSLRLWAPEKWQQLIQWLEERKILPIITSGPGEAHLIAEVDPEKRHLSYPGDLSLAELWRLFASARFLICPDTGVSHLAKLTGVPAVTLYGPGSAVLFGAGLFWHNSRYRAVTISDFPCRNQNLVFGRIVPWAGHCARTTKQCASPRCMATIDVEMVSMAAKEFIQYAASVP